MSNWNHMHHNINNILNIHNNYDRTYNIIHHNYDLPNRCNMQPNNNFNFDIDSSNNFNNYNNLSGRHKLPTNYNHIILNNKFNYINPNYIHLPNRHNMHNIIHFNFIN